MPFADLSHARIHYQLDGPPTAPVLVLSNSLGTDLHLWDAQLPGLIPHLRALRYDTRGHGLSTAPGNAFTLDDLGTDVLDLLDNLGIASFHVCGISLGGLTALWLAVHAPARVLSLMPCNTAARIGTTTGWNARIDQVTAHGLAPLADATMERWFTPSFRSASPALVEATRQVILATDPHGYAACCAALRDADLASAIASITAPTLVISGAHDPVTPPSDGLFLERHIPAARYLELPAAHLSNIEASAAFLTAILDSTGSG